ncbi:hypothetical protein CDEST_01679 [Colletotrichum destructivum]|uniref:Zn(2)-C6 fungal-type domain-containing protein n=1 Tax=Colletotrichum destructivum TaxID=34406 RepID=A0AAX4I130_9PEZI|nr:hypothetical protein CDEST_01679 [Colletotrichum destructivum]
MTKRACDGCRRRKVKCDAKSPQCSNCFMSTLTCEFTVAPKKRGPPFRARRGAHKRTSQSGSNDELPLHNNTAMPLLGTPDGGGSASISTTASLPAVSPGNNVSVGGETAPDFYGKPPFRVAIDDLLSALGMALPYVPLEDVISTCIDLFMQWEFPSIPVVCEPLLRRSIHVVVPVLRDETPGRPISDMIPTLRAFALLTALCAVVSAVLPPEIFPSGVALSMPFLRTSREALRLYQDLDIEQPDSSSIIIRYFHSNALHALGKTRVSFHAMGEALRLVQEMRLYDESSFQGLEWPENHLRRNTFWHLYIGDKSASILNQVPITLHQICLDTPITTHFDESQACGLMQPEGPDTVVFEGQLRLCFHLCFRLWYTASEMLLDLNLLSRLQGSSRRRAITLSSTAAEPDDVPSSLRTSTMQSYLDFTSILQSCPAWLRDPGAAVPDGVGETTARFRTRAISVQKANLFITFHALRLVLLSRFSERGFADVLGLTGDPVMLAMRKVEIAGDLLDAVSDMPFEALQANGEPCVEKLRQVGVALLEIIHNVSSEVISARARSLFGTLLDVLARLNSKVSDELSNDCES